ncbi:MAG: AMP-binding protein, partial [Acidimicrobiales bacterium]
LRGERAELEGWVSGQDSVGLYLLNGPAYLEGNLAGYAARAAPFNVNYRYVADELAYLLDDADTAALIYHARFAPTLEQVLPRLRRRPVLLQVADESSEPLLEGAIDYEAALAAAPASPPPADQDPDDLYILYTGGTTGMPKGTCGARPTSGGRPSAWTTGTPTSTRSSTTRSTTSRPACCPTPR